MELHSNDGNVKMTTDVEKNEKINYFRIRLFPLRRQATQTSDVSVKEKAKSFTSVRLSSRHQPFMEVLGCNNFEEMQ